MSGGREGKGGKWSEKQLDNTEDEEGINAPPPLTPLPPPPTPPPPSAPTSTLLRDASSCRLSFLVLS